MTTKRMVHLVGSVPLETTEAVFDAVCGAVGDHLNRIPDGETGVRKGWIGFQRAMLEQHHAVMLNPAGRTVPIRDLQGGVSRENNLFVLNPDVPVDEIVFRPLGYVQPAVDSFAVFQAKQQSGQIPPDVRFQVSLPTPFATGLLYFHPDSQDAYIQLMKKALLEEMSEICDRIPHHSLAIQWDCCQEILLLEDYFPDDWVYDSNNLHPTLAELGNAVPTNVELGYHLCYGSPVDAPLVKQDDLGVAVNLANLIASGLKRPLNFMHIPISDPTASDAFFAPLTQLNLPSSSEIYLGLLHPKNPDNDAQRIQLAQKYLPQFGVATECGWGRKQPETVPHVLQVHQTAVSI